MILPRLPSRHEFLLTSNYYRRLFKATLLISVVPFICMILMVLYERIAPLEGLVGCVAIFFGSTFFARPYLADLMALNHYVKELTHDRKTNMPPLSFLGNVEELSASVKKLHASWNKRKIQLESALAETSILFDILPDILLMLDEELTILRANQEAHKILGAELVNQKINHVITDTQLINCIKKATNTGNGGQIDISITHDDLRLNFKASIERFPVYSAGGIASIVMLHDVTEAKRTKEMLKNFVANASHEIRTPLTSINGFIETLKTVDYDDEATREKFLNIIDEQAKHMTMLVNDLLSLSTIEMKENTPPKDIIDVGESISHAVTSTQWQASKRGMNIALELDNALPLIVGDVNELTQVMNNLISNAIKYGYQDTSIIIKTGVVKHPGKKDRIFISVQNEGDGIPEKDLPNLTQRFFRLDKVRQNISGAGLGLAIVKHILNRHKGDMLVESEEGKYSKFTVRIPVASQSKIKKSQAQ